MTDEPILAMSAKDHGLTAAILGFFAMAWFGWGHDGATTAVGVFLDVGAVLSAITLIAGLVGLTTDVKPGVVTGAGGGLCLLGFAAGSLVRAKGLRQSAAV